MVLRLAEIVRETTFEGPADARLDASLTEEEELERRTRTEVNVLASLTKAAADLASSEDRQ